MASFTTLLDLHAPGTDGHDLVGDGQGNVVAYSGEQMAAGPDASVHELSSWGTLLSAHPQLQPAASQVGAVTSTPAASKAAADASFAGPEFTTFAPASEPTSKPESPNSSPSTGADTAAPVAPVIEAPHSADAPRPQCSCALCQGLARQGGRDLLSQNTAVSAGAVANITAVGRAGQDQSQQPVGANVDPGTSTPILSSLTIADADVFNLESAPGAEKTIYLNFLGADLRNSAWYSSTSGWDGIAPVFSMDTDVSTNFSSTELAAIKSIFTRVACDYAPFNVNVTTKAPSADRLSRSSTTDSIYGTTCLFSAISSQTGYSTSGGVAYVGVYDSTSDFYKPALVFPEKLGSAKNMGEAASHEVGHTLGLSHDGTSTATYYKGQGTSPGWAPIMGSAYGVGLSQFSRGTYVDANNKENDFSVIGSKGLTYWADSVGNTTAAAKSITLSDTNLDGIGDRLSYGGTIELSSSDGLGTPDRDLYGFVADASGSLTINIRNALYYFDPAKSSYVYAPVSSGFGNLRLDAQLLDAAGTVLADWNTNSSLDVANFSVSGLTGQQNYYLSVFANANSPDGEDTYGSLGDYVVDLSYQYQASSTPLISLDLNAASVVEDGSGNLTYTFYRTGSTASTLTVGYAVAGSADAATDYSLIGPAGSVVFAAGSSTATIVVDPTADQAVEGDETVALSLVAGSGYTLNTTTAVVGTIVEDDLPTYSLTGAASADEGTTAQFALTTTNVADGSVLNWTVSGTNVSASDLSPASLNGTVTVQNGAAALNLLINADNELESAETANVVFSNAAGQQVAASTLNLVDTNRDWGTTGSDTVLGADNRFEQITGVTATGTNANQLGVAQIDKVTGGIGADDFLLSEVRSGSLRVFYDDAVKNNTGSADYLQITDFNKTQDRLRFAAATGSRYFTRDVSGNAQVWFDRDNNASLNMTTGKTNSDELIAVLTGVSLGSNTLISGATQSWAVFA